MQYLDFFNAGVMFGAGFTLAQTLVRMAIWKYLWLFTAAMNFPKGKALHPQQPDVRSQS